MHKTWLLTEQGDRCLLVQFSGELSLDTGLRCTRAARLLRDHAPACVRDLVPSFTAVAIHFYPDGSSDQLARLHDYVHQALAELDGLAPVYGLGEQTKRDLQRAQIFELLGQKDDAAHLYEEVIDRDANLEARCRYAAMLVADGEDL